MRRMEDVAYQTLQGTKNGTESVFSRNEVERPLPERDEAVSSPRGYWGGFEHAHLNGQTKGSPPALPDAGTRGRPSHKSIE